MLTGYYLQLQFDDIEDAFVDNIQQYRDQGYPLTKGTVFDIPEKNCKKLKFDFNGLTETWDGYVVGHLYPDKKFLGTFHPLKESGAPDTKLNGTYQYTGGIIKISGIEYGGTDKSGFYIELADSTEVILPGQDISDKESKYIKVLSANLSSQLSAKAEKNKKKAVKYFDHYQGLINANLKPGTSSDFLLAVSAAYSWMPTMLELYTDQSNNFEQELSAVRELGVIKTVADFEANETGIEKSLTLLTNTINHSVVGVSKTLHLFYPDTVPIIDSRVLRAWQRLFGKYYKKQPDLKLPKIVPYASSRQVPLYMKYWKLMLCWKENSKVGSIRQLEEPLYWIGKK